MISEDQLNAAATAADAAYAAAHTAAAADAAYAAKKEEVYKQIIYHGLQLLSQQKEKE